MTKTDKSPGVVYVMTHYPKLAQTFIQTEIDALRSTGITIACVALNAAEAHELERPGADARAAGTIYLKPNLSKSLSALARVTVRHPLRMATVWRKAIASGGGQPGRILRRLAHLAHGARVEAVTRQLGLSHVHAHFGLAPTTIAWLASAIGAALNRPLHFTFTIHGFHDFADPAETRLDCKVPDADGVVCVSDFTRSQLYLNSAPVDWAKAHVVRCGLDLSAFEYRDPPPIKAEPVLVALGRLSPEKGIGILIEALGELAGQGEQVPQLRLVGDGPQRRELENRVKDYHLDSHVKFLGELPPEDVRAELAAADIFCMASFSEGLPVSLMEAMAIGIPSITTWISGIPELAENGVSALTVPPARADAMAAAIKRLMNDPELRQSLARSARVRIEAHHDARQSAKRLGQLMFGDMA